MIKCFVVGCFFKASLSRLQIDCLRQLKQQKVLFPLVPNYDNVLSYYSSCSPSFFFVWLLSCFIKNLLALCYLCFHVEDDILCMIAKTQFTYRKWLHKYFVFFMWTYIFLPFSHWLHNVTPGALCKHHTYVDSAWKWLIFLVAFISIFRIRHWKFFRKTAVRKDITKTVIFFTTLELVFSTVY